MPGYLNLVLEDLFLLFLFLCRPLNFLPSCLRDIFSSENANNWFLTDTVTFLSTRGLKSSFFSGGGRREWGWGGRNLWLNNNSNNLTFESTVSFEINSWKPVSGTKKCKKKKAIRAAGDTDNVQRLKSVLGKCQIVYSQFIVEWYCKQISKNKKVLPLSLNQSLWSSPALVAFFLQIYTRGRWVQSLICHSILMKVLGTYKITLLWK